MKPFRGITNTLLIMTLAAVLSGCASYTQPADGAQQPSVASEIAITADPDSVLAHSVVEIGTIPAPANLTSSAMDPAPHPAAASFASPVNGHAWIDATMAKYGVYPQAGTQFVIGPMPAGCEGSHGCTQYAYYHATGEYRDYIITILPDQLTEYLLIHEIAHASGIRDECAADNFTRKYLGAVPGHYC